MLVLTRHEGELEMVVTEELYAVALQSRMCVADDHETYDYQPEQEQEAMRPPPAMIHTMGKFPREPRNQRYMLEFTMGREQKRSEHKDTVTQVIFDTPQMSGYARRGRNCP